MMRALSNKKNVKIISFVVAAVFVLGIGGYSMMSMGNVANAAPTSSIGVVDQNEVVGQNTGIGIEYQSEMMTAADELQKEFDEKSANMTDEEKEKYFQDLQQKFAEKRNDIDKNMQSKIDVAVKEVAEKKGLVLVVDKAVVLYGGVDISNDVQVALTKSTMPKQEEKK